MINGTEYGWENMEVVIEGKAIPLSGITEVKYKATKVHENIAGRGNDSVSMGRGRKDYDGSITLLQSEAEAMQKNLPRGKDLCDLSPFTITVAYVGDDGQKVVDNLTGCRVLDFEKGGGTEDTHMKIQLSLKIFKINYNVA